MINSINSNFSIWQMMNNQMQTRQSAKISITKDEMPTAPQPTHSVFSKDALFSGGMTVGSGFMNARVDWSPNTTDDNPIMLVRGTDDDGRQFEVEVAVNKINPRNASAIELFALDGYSVANGHTQGMSATRAAAWAGAMTLGGASNGQGAFAKFDILSALDEIMESYRFHGDLNGYTKSRELADFLMNFPR
jgi:hypothetical protein